MSLCLQQSSSFSLSFFYFNLQLTDRMTPLPLLTGHGSEGACVFHIKHTTAFSPISLFNQTIDDYPIGKGHFSHVTDTTVNLSF